MDSLTQLAFGAACGEALLGQQVGRKALAWGAVLGTLPDLDVFIPLGGPVNDFVYHRGFSHSILLLGLLSPVIAWVISRVHPGTKRFYGRWLLLSFLVLEGSVLLDLLTVYGTQVFWPFDTTPLAVPVLFIIDPLFSLPIGFGVLAVLLLRRHRPLGHRLNTVGLVLSLDYLTWALGAGEFVKRRVAERLAHQGVSYSQVLSSPAPFTTLLRRVVGIEDAPLAVDFHPRHLALMRGIERHPPVVKLRRFTRGYYAFSTVDGHVAMTDLRMLIRTRLCFPIQGGQDERFTSHADCRRKVDIDPGLAGPGMGMEKNLEPHAPMGS